MILAGDLGGTKANLAIYEPGNLVTPVFAGSFPSRNYSSFLDILRDFQKQHSHSISKACFGVAGPIINGVGDISNLKWLINEKEIAQLLHIPAAKLLNDLEATAYGCLQMRGTDLEILNQGLSVQHGNIAVIAAGTGLGEGFLIWDGSRYKAIASEGGHTDFAPKNAVEVELLRFLQKKYSRVSYERALSGMGLSNIFDFLTIYRNSPVPSELKTRFVTEDKNAVISELAAKGINPICEEALNMMVSIYGAEAGNLALKIMSHGGIFIGGGIAPKILSKLKEPRFLHAFHNKGRLGSVLKNFPVKVVLNDKAGLVGAAYYAQEYF